jgi:hypothetical protein
MRAPDQAPFFVFLPFIGKIPKMQEKANKH